MTSPSCTSSCTEWAPDHIHPKSWHRHWCSCPSLPGQLQTCLYLVTGTEQRRCIIDINTLALEWGEDICKSLLGLRAYTGTDSTVLSKATARREKSWIWFKKFKFLEGQSKCLAIHLKWVWNFTPTENISPHTSMGLPTYRPSMMLGTVFSVQGSISSNSCHQLSMHCSSIQTVLIM